jgi:hypothetical protein
VAYLREARCVASAAEMFPKEKLGELNRGRDAFKIELVPLSMGCLRPHV